MERFYFFWLTVIYFAESMTPDESLPTKQTVVFLNFISDFNATNYQTRYSKSELISVLVLRIASHHRSATSRMLDAVLSY